MERKMWPESTCTSVPAWWRHPTVWRTAKWWCPCYNGVCCSLVSQLIVINCGLLLQLPDSGDLFGRLHVKGKSCVSLEAAGRWRGWILNYLWHVGSFGVTPSGASLLAEAGAEWPCWCDGVGCPQLECFIDVSLSVRLSRFECVARVTLISASSGFFSFTKLSYHHS